jgi:hypothetical protein
MEEAMPITRYIGPGVAFGPEAISTMSKAFEDAVTALGIGDDKTKREAVAQFILKIAEKDMNLDAKDLRDRTVDALCDQTLFLAIVKDEKPDAHRT